MGKYSLISRPGSLLSYQANAYFAQLLTDLQSPKIQSKLDLLSAVSNIFNRFYANLGQPLVSPMAFYGIPIAEDWNQYQTLLSADLGILYRQTNDINQVVVNQAAFESVELSLLKEAINTLSNRVSSFKPTRATRSGLQNWNIGDNFFDYSRVDLSNSTVIIRDQAAQLQPTEMVDYSNEATVYIDDEFVNTALFNNPNATDIGTGASNGFIGNLHEVKVTDAPGTSSITDGITQAVGLSITPGTSVSFVGDSDLHADIAAVTDTNPNTWFEYEVCNISDVLKYNPCLNYGFKIEVPQTGSNSPLSIPWFKFHDSQIESNAPSFFPAPPGTTSIHPTALEADALGNYTSASQSASINAFSTSSLNFAASAGSIGISESGAPSSGGVLRLVLSSVFANPQRLTEISIIPNVIANKAPTVKSVQVRADNSTIWLNAVPLRESQSAMLSNTQPLNVETSAISTWTFPATVVKYVRIVIEQDQPYAAKIGHFVWIEQTSNDNGIINSLLGGIAFDPTSQYERIDGPEPSLAKILKGQTSVTETIEGIESYTSNVSSYSTADGKTAIGPLVEVFDGWRYAIAIKYISFSSITYQPTGVLITKDFSVPVDIKTISLDVSELIPEAQMTDEWIKYELSLDGGESWHPIAPKSHYTSTSPRTYNVNPASGPALISTSPNTLTTSKYDPHTNPATSVRLRASFNRPSSDPTATPRLLNYSINIEGNSL